MKLRRNSYYDGFENNFERDIKRVVQMDWFTDEVLSSFGQLAIGYKMGMRLFSFFTSGTQQKIWCVAYSMYCRFRKYISNRAFLKPISKNVTPDFRAENMVSFKKV